MEKPKIDNYKKTKNNITIKAYSRKCESFLEARKSCFLEVALL